MSIPKLIEETKQLLVENDKNKEGVDFDVPSKSWVYLQLSPMGKNRKTANSYTGKLAFKHKLASWEERDSLYPHAHWVAVTKKNGRVMLLT